MTTPYVIDIRVNTRYLPDQSTPEQNRYAFAYTITIINRGAKPAKLLRRHWVITDGNQRVQEVHGEGVVGQQPRLNPGQNFQYTSGAVIDTKVGSMYGEFTFTTDEGELFDAPIAPFTLADPHAVN